MREAQNLLKISDGHTWHTVTDGVEKKNHARNLLQATTQNEDTAAKSGGLSVAWIAAIVINAILIALFILVVIYCYCKNRKQRDLSQSDSIRKDYHSNGDIMYVEKAAVNRGPEKAALIGAADTVYTVEGDRGRYRRHPPHRHHHSHGENERCNCSSPECYCSMGDEEGRQIESRSRSVEHMFREDPEKEVKESRMPSPEPEPFAATPQVEEVWRPDSEPHHLDRDDVDVRFSPPPPTPESDLQTEKHYQIYRVLDGVKTKIGQTVLTGDVTLNELRLRIQENNSIYRAAGANFRFLNEDFFELSVFQEATLDLDHVYPYQAIYLKNVQANKALKKKAPTYVGPLGLCSAPDCTEPARIKCLDCGNTNYCSTKCLRDDIANHKKRCYKPPWRL